jgi:predicted Kef-type K+ transport protein
VWAPSIWLLSIALFAGVLLLLGVNVVAALLVAVGLGFSSTVLAAKSLEVARRTRRLSRPRRHRHPDFSGSGGCDIADFYRRGVAQLGGLLTLLALPLLRPLLWRGLSLSGKGELMLIYGLLLALGVGWLFEYWAGSVPSWGRWWLVSY